MADFEYTVNIPGKGAITVPSDTALQPTEAYQKALAMISEAQPQVTGGEPGQPSMLQRAGGYLQKNIVQPITDVASMASEDIKGAMIPGYKKKPDPEEALSSLMKIGGAAAFPAAGAGALVGGTVAAGAGGGEKLQMLGELIGGGIGGAKGIKDIVTKLLTNKEAQITKFTEQFLKTPQALKEGITKLLPGFSDQATTVAKQIEKPLARDVDALYEIARKTTGQVPTKEIRQIASRVMGEEAGGLGYPEVKQVMAKTLQSIPSVSDEYANLLKVSQRLEGQAEKLAAGASPKNKDAARIIRGVKNEINDALDKYSNAGRLANSLNRQDHLARRMLENLRTGKIEQVKIDLINDSEVASRFGWNTPEKIQAAVKQLDKIKSTPTRGSVVEALQRLGGSGLLAYALHRGIFDAVFSGHGRGGE